MRLFSLLLCFLVAGCQGCAFRNSSTRWDSRGDSDAAYAQKLMRQTAEIFVKGSTLVPDLTAKKPELKTVHFGAQGSGTVIAKKGNGKQAESLLLTADHLCQVAKKETIDVPLSDEIKVTAPVLGMEVHVYSIEMERMEAEIIYQDPENDLCVMKVAGDAGEVAAVATDMAPLGAVIQHAGAPQDNFAFHMAYISDGRYVGMQPVPKEKIVLDTFSCPSAPGGSGGGIYYRGKLIGTLTRVAPPYGDISYGPPLVYVQAAVKEGKRIWLGQPSTKTSVRK